MRKNGGECEPCGGDGSKIIGVGMDGGMNDGVGWEVLFDGLQKKIIDLGSIFGSEGGGCQCE